MWTEPPNVCKLCRTPSERTSELAAAARAAADTTATPIVVEASSPGFAPARVTIPTSTDLAADGVMAVAAAGAGKSVRI